MDPGRQAMIDGRRSPIRRNVTSARVDANNRISKSTKPGPSKTAQHATQYLTAEEQSRKFVADEDKFVLKQSKKKADIRVREGRAKPIDRLAFNLRYIDEERDVFDDDEGDIDIELDSPEATVQGLTLTQLQELESDISSYHILETDRRNRQYWEALRTICADFKSKIDTNSRDGRVVKSVVDDIDRILGPKSYDELEALEKQIKAKLRSDENIDTDYWEQLLHHLLVWKSKATLARIYDEIKDKRAERLKARGPVARRQQDPTSIPSPVVHSDLPRSPQPGASEDASNVTNALYNREAAKGVSENEEIFNAEEQVPARSKPQWAGIYKARKPRYFNRVQMGYEWNKYNQTHYDHDNPPPKVVQGYKFNIFYPDLVDKTKAPTFKIIREHGRRRGESFAAAGETDTCLILFIAGPPYEDIAFRIVDREWDYSAKRDRGFKSSFEKGILQLHFQFKKIFYRK
ncbi:Cactin, domain protein [Metarhizium album ARSEF 1941]|uniref:Splicing factor Cactin n=1 Tax=Metarhizium album (strain ARSEF 1941) TaxID=1081103 RepID=A0A0B2WMD9_METAS|nr:Cactin, domain protein [Metarhizium album ARSEF 1941]KHN94657.1 Cactin, domain protein [Metarhizium album ARSEF 1941]